MNITEYPDQDMMMIDLANVLAGEIGTVLTHNERATLAVPGGTTPGPMFDDLCAADLEWSRVDVLLTDERWVPETDERSNTRLIRQRLLTDKASAANLLPLYADAEQPEEVLPDLRKQISPHLPIDILILGMGTDMHTASLFPGADNLEDALDKHAPVIVPIRKTGLGETRVSLSFPALTGAINAHLLITGNEKRRALEEAAKIDDPLRAPISAFLSDIMIHWAP